MDAAVVLHEAAELIEGLDLPEDAAKAIRRIAVELRTWGDQLDAIED